MVVEWLGQAGRYAGTLKVVGIGFLDAHTGLGREVPAIPANVWSLIAER